MRAVIIEDEKNGREILMKLLEMHCPEIIVCSTATSVKSGIKLIKDYAPELVFMDIKLGSENSFDIFKEIEDEGLNFNTIFTTAYEEYAIKAIKNDASDYLLKPIDSDELRNAVDKVLTLHKEKLLQSKDRLSFDSVLTPQKIKIHNRSGFELVEIDSIIYCQSEVNYTRFYFKDRKTILTSKTLKHYQLMLEKYWFQRIHKSLLINIKEVQRFIQGKGGQVVMSSGDVLEVGGNYKKELLQKLEL